MHVSLQVGQHWLLKLKVNAELLLGGKSRSRQPTEKAIFWNTLWKENDSPTYGLIYEIRQRTRRDYHYDLRKLRDG